jgi:hypothetical protein
MALDTLAPITEDWLKEIGFRWHQLDRQPAKHWVLWMGEVVDGGRGAICFEDLGIEISPVGHDDEWFCWLRADYSGRYSRFIHLRHIRTHADLIFILEGIAGTGFSPEHCFGGIWMTPERAARAKGLETRLDRVVMREQPWRCDLPDDGGGRALPEHQQAFIEARKDQ